MVGSGIFGAAQVDDGHVEARDILHACDIAEPVGQARQARRETQRGIVLRGEDDERVGQVSDGLGLRSEHDRGDVGRQEDHAADARHRRPVAAQRHLAQHLHRELRAHRMRDKDDLAGARSRRSSSICSSPSRAKSAASRSAA
jgi:hypothetical protein